MTLHASPAAEAAETVGGVILDLVQISSTLPLPPSELEPIAKLLDRLSVEIREAATLLRMAADAPSSAGGEAVRRKLG